MARLSPGGMSYSLPQNVPSFSNPAEDRYWSGSGISRTHNGHTGSGIAGKVDGFFDKRQLPMYKDKPYSYAASRRIKPFYKRRRFWFALTLLILGQLYWFELLPSISSKANIKSTGTSAWSWLSQPGASTVDWDDRRERVKEAFTLSWDGYEQYAWGMCN